MSIYFSTGKSYRRPNLTHIFSYQTVSRLDRRSVETGPQRGYKVTPVLLCPKETGTSPLVRDRDNKNLVETAFLTRVTIKERLPFESGVVVICTGTVVETDCIEILRL